MVRMPLRGVSLKVIGAIFALLLLSASVSRAASVTLQWNANTESTLKGYKIYYKTGTSGPPYNGTGISQGSSPITVPLTSLADAANPEFTLLNLNDSQSYYIAITAYSDTAQSAYSNEVIFQAGSQTGPGIIDNTDAGFSTEGSWPTSTTYPGYYGANYGYASAGNGSIKATWTFQVGSAGQYRISAWWSAHSGRTPDAPYTIYNNGVELGTVRVDQRIDGGQFNELGTYQLAVGTVEVVLSNDSSPGYIIADAVELVASSSSPPSGSIDIDNLDAGFTTVGTWSASVKYPGYYGDNYQWVDPGTGTKKATWTFQVGSAGQYRISAWWSAYSSFARDAPYTVYNNGVNRGTVRVDQRVNGGRFNELGTYQLAAGTVEVVLSDDVSSGYVIADAVGLAYIDDGSGGGSVDSDGDGINDVDEVSVYGTDPDKSDSDGDGLNDGDEIDYWGADWDADPDADGLYNLLDSDSDNDGHTDGAEVDGGFNPADANSSPGSQTGPGIIDNTDAGFSTEGSWPTSTTYPGYYGANYGYASAGNGSIKATWTFQVGSAGQYRISAWWSAHSGRTPDAPYTIYNNGVKLGTVRVDQRIDGGQFNELGTYQLAAGTVEVVLSNDSSPGYIIADAVELVASSSSPPSGSIDIDNLDAGFTTVGTWSASVKYPGYYGDNYQWVDPGTGTQKATWTFQVGSAGQYRISAWWSASFGRAPDAPYTIYNNGVKLGTVRVDQRIDGGQFNELGTYQLAAGTVEVVLSNDVSTGYVIADAVELEPLSGSSPPGSTNIDNMDTGFTTVGTWSVSNNLAGYYGDNYQWAIAGSGSKTATWTFQVSSAGQYHIAAWWAAHSSRAPDAPYTIYNNGAELGTVRVDQRTNGGQFNTLGTYQLAAGTVEVVLSNDVSSGYVIADAVSMGPQ